MRRCRPLARLKLASSAQTLHPCHVSNIPPQCILSIGYTSLRLGPTSSLSTLRTSHLRSPAPLHEPLQTSSLNNHCYRRSFLHAYHKPAQYGDNKTQIRQASSKRWTARQTTDPYTRLAKVQNLKSRAAFKLLQINEKYPIFKRGQTIVDLGFAPGSWSQVAINLVKPTGRVLGVDLIPAQPPKGVSAIQGDFLSPEVQEEVRRFVRDPERGRLRHQPVLTHPNEADVATSTDDKGYIDSALSHSEDHEDQLLQSKDGTADGAGERCVDVVLSDMSEPWELIDGHYKRTLSNPYRRMMNTSGNAFRDHFGSMDLCLSALAFAYTTLKANGHLVLKFYQGAEDKSLEARLRALFTKVHREKPESSRSESKEAYFVALKRKPNVSREAVFGKD